MYRATAYHRECEFCHDAFDSPQTYSSHKRRHHPNWRNDTAAESPMLETSSYECDTCHRTFANRQSLSAHARWCKNQHEQEPHPLGDDSGPVPVNESNQPRDTQNQKDFYCIYCREDLTSLVRDLLAVGNASWEDFSYCPACGRNIRKALTWAVVGHGEG